MKACLPVSCSTAPGDKKTHIVLVDQVGILGVEVADALEDHVGERRLRLVVTVQA